MDSLVCTTQFHRVLQKELRINECSTEKDLPAELKKVNRYLDPPVGVSWLDYPTRPMEASRQGTSMVGGSCRVDLEKSPLFCTLRFRGSTGLPMENPPPPLKRLEGRTGDP